MVRVEQHEEAVVDDALAARVRGRDRLAVQEDGGDVYPAESSLQVADRSLVVLKRLG